MSTDTIFGIHFDAEARRRFLNESRRELFEPKSYLFREHQKASKIYMIESGELVIERTTSGGDRQITNLLFPGNIVGHSNHDFYHYGVVTLTAVSVRTMPSDLFAEIGSATIETKDKQLRALGEILLDQVDYLFVLARKKAHERLCYLLCELIEKQSSGADGVIKLNMSRQDIADYLGLTSESVTRGFSKLHKEGVVEIESPREIQVLQSSVVREWAGKLMKN